VCFVHVDCNVLLVWCLQDGKTPLHATACGLAEAAKVVPLLLSCPKIDVNASDKVSAPGIEGCLFGPQVGLFGLVLCFWFIGLCSVAAQPSRETTLFCAAAVKGPLGKVLTVI
jgi:hypothetical protein